MSTGVPSVFFCLSLYLLAYLIIRAYTCVFLQFSVCVCLCLCLFLCVLGIPACQSEDKCFVPEVSQQEKET